MSPSSLAWIDTSPEEQRRARELLQMFEQKESRDELGIGSIRDVLSDLLFPGMSVLQTRARYYLFVPWCYRKAAEKGLEGDRLFNQARSYERYLPDALKSVNGGADGIIGARVGAALKTLPSDIYWNGLGTFGILQRNATTRSLRAARGRVLDADELAERMLSDWHPSLPPVPKGFPQTVDGGFTLTSEEAAWLRERMMAGAHGSLLEKVLGAEHLSADADAAWLDPDVLAVAGEALPILRHAEQFSRAMRGANLLYDLLVAEAFVDADLGDNIDLQTFRDRYEDWAVRAAADPALAAWDVVDFQRLVTNRNDRITPLAWAFVHAWHEQIRTGAAVGGSEPQTTARHLVATREQRLKGTQSRLSNRKLLAQWGGANGSRPDPDASYARGGLTYRWPNARRIALDIQEGLRA